MTDSPQASRGGKWHFLIFQIIAVVGVFFLAIALWLFTAVFFGLPPALLPKPGQVLDSFHDNRDFLINGLFATGTAAIAGLLAAIAIGTVIGVAFAQSRYIRLAFFPYVVFLQTVPIVAITPLLIVWSGYRFRTVVIATVIVCLFPIINSVTAGLLAVDRQWSDLFKLYGASRTQRLTRLQIPSAIPYLVLGVKTSSGLAVIGAVVAEFFVGNGSQDYDGLGTLMMKWQGFLKIDALIAAVITSTILGLFLFGLVGFIARVFLGRWMNPTR